METTITSIGTQSHWESQTKWYKKHPNYMKEYEKKWLIKHPNYMKEYGKKWLIKHPNYMKEYGKKWRKEHYKPHPQLLTICPHKNLKSKCPKCISEYQKKWYKKHHQPHPRLKKTLEQLQQRRKEYNLKYYSTHKEQLKKQKQEYYQRPEVKQRINQEKKIYRKNHPEKRKAIEKRHEYKRRGLGFIELNYPFEGSEAHHIDKNLVVYIPHKLHESIYHNIWTGQGMVKINTKTFEWLGIPAF